MSANKHSAIEKEDIGRVLSALLDLRDIKPLEAYSKFVSSDGRRFKAQVEKEEISVKRLWKLTLRRDDLIFIGGGGVVLQVRNADVSSIKYALKFMRPSLLENSEEEHTRTALYETRQEYLNHVPLSHTNVARVFGAGITNKLQLKSTISASTHPVLIEWVDGATPLWDHLVHKTKDVWDVVEVVSQSFEAIAYLNDSGLIHWDIKSDNLLVSGEGVPKLMDIGNARRFTDVNRDMTAYSTKGNLPDEIEPSPKNQHTYDSRRYPVSLPDASWDSPWLDMWMLAWDLNQLFGAYLPNGREYKNISSKYPIAELQEAFRSRMHTKDDPSASYVYASLQLILCRLLRSKRPSDTPYYRNAHEVVADLKKLKPEFGAAQGIAELHSVPQSVLRLPVSINVPFTSRIRRIYNTSSLRKLREHMQLATVWDTYPGASHRRYEHVAGVLAMVCDFVRALYSDRTTPFWRLQVEGRDIDALLLAGVLHDVGHIAFGHFLEEMSGLVQGRTHESILVILLDSSRAQEVWPGWNIQSSLAIELDIEREELRKTIVHYWVPGDNDVVEFMRMVGAIIKPPPHESPVTQRSAVLFRHESERMKVEILHSIIDSGIDADKLDYLKRDAHHAGVIYPNGVDLARFFQALTTVTYIPKEKRGLHLESTTACIAVSSKGQLPAESVLIGRYQMFSAVYWQHTTRAQTVMLQTAVQAYLDTVRSAKGANALFENLVLSWRNLDDRSALVWLKEKLMLSEQRLGKEYCRTLCSMVDALLGNRNGLYWAAFELRFQPRAANHSSARAIGEYWIKQASTLAESKSSTVYIHRIREINRAVTKQLNKSLPSKCRINDGELIVDIPPAGKDQIDNVFVVRGEEVNVIQDLTPIAEAVHEAFSHWVRAMRVFLSPTAWNRLYGEGMTETILSEKLESELEMLATRQPELFS